jgi:hypothetical protein
MYGISKCNEEMAKVFGRAGHCSVSMKGSERDGFGLKKITGALSLRAEFFVDF